MTKNKTLHIHPFAGTRGELTSPGVAVIESGLKGFSEENSEALTFPFEALGEIPAANAILIDLPFNDMVNGTGKGYLLDLAEYIASECDMEFKKYLKIEFPFWGAPITDTRLFLLMSKEEYQVPVTLSGTALGEVLPHVAFHAPSVQRRNLLYPGFYSMFGYVNSATATLPAPREWKGKYPMCEKRVGDSLSVSRLDKHDIEALWSYVPLSNNPDELSRVTPLIVLQTFLNRLKTTDQK